jgi:hypothetical protein
LWCLLHDMLWIVNVICLRPETVFCLSLFSECYHNTWIMREREQLLMKVCESADFYTQ